MKLPADPTMADLEDVATLREDAALRQDAPRPRRAIIERRVPESAHARARREAFFVTAGPTEPPGGKAVAVARRRAALEARGR